TPPGVSIATPADGAPAGGRVDVLVLATDAVGVAAVTARVSRDGADVADLGTRTAPPFAFTWQTDALAGGRYWIEARATDAAGLTATTTRSVLLGGALGAACGQGGACASGFCVDGVCCAD